MENFQIIYYNLYFWFTVNNLKNILVDLDLQDKLRNKMHTVLLFYRKS